MEKRTASRRKHSSVKSEIRGLIIDLDNTLYDYESAHMAGLESARNLYPVRYNKQRFLRKYATHRDNNEKALLGTGASHNRILYFQRMLESDNCFSPQLALKLNKRYWDAFLRTMTVTADTKKTLLALVRKYKLGILTDLTADIQFAKMDVHRLWPFFDAIVTSEEAGAEKPNTTGLKLLLAKMKLTPSQVIYVGDNPVNDGIVAKRLHIPYVRIMRADMRTMKHGAVAWKKIKKFKELLNILKDL